MTDKMIVPMGVIGGNQIEMVNPRLAGKVRITNPEGKVKTLSVDEFQKQVIANQDKIKDGEDVEFKSDNGKKALKIGAAVLGTAAVVAGVIYRKDIAKYIKNFTWKGFKEDIKNMGKKIKNFGKKIARGVKNLFKGNKKPQTVFDGTTASRLPGDAKTARETLALKNSTIVEMAKADAKDFARMKARTKKSKHAAKQARLEKVFASLK